MSDLRLVGPGWHLLWSWCCEQVEVGDAVSMNMWRDFEGAHLDLLERAFQDKEEIVQLNGIFYSLPKRYQSIFLIVAKCVVLTTLQEWKLDVNGIKYDMRRVYGVEKGTLVSRKHIQWEVIHDETTWISIPKELSGSFENHLASNTLRFYYLSPVDGRKVYVDLNELSQVDEMTQLWVPLRRLSFLEPVKRKDIIWQWLDDIQTWRDYSDDICLLMEEHFHAGLKSCEFELQNSLFRVDFDENMQTNVQTNFSRVIRRVTISNSELSKTVDIIGQGAGKSGEDNPSSTLVASTDSAGNHRDLCAVCQVNMVNILYLPCNHASVCSECHEKIADNRCVICRSDVEKSIKFNLHGI